MKHNILSTLLGPYTAPLILLHPASLALLYFYVFSGELPGVYLSAIFLLGYFILFTLALENRLNRPVKFNHINKLHLFLNLLGSSLKVSLIFTNFGLLMLVVLFLLNLGSTPGGGLLDFLINNSFWAFIFLGSLLPLQLMLVAGNIVAVARNDFDESIRRSLRLLLSPYKTELLGIVLITTLLQSLNQWSHLILEVKAGQMWVSLFFNLINIFLFLVLMVHMIKGLINNYSRESFVKEII